MSDSHWKSRRLAPRAKKVIGRHADKPAVAAFASSLVPKADTFIVDYDTAGRHEATWRREMGEGRGAMAALDNEIAAWKPHVARERPGFDLSTIGDRPTVPEDLIEDGHALADELDEIRGADGAAPAWATAAAVSVRAKADDAERETDEAAAADVTHNEQLARVRTAKAVFDAELALFRETLRVVLGRNHPDFQKLRARKASAPDEDDDPRAPQASGPVIPMPPPT